MSNSSNGDSTSELDIVSDGREPVMVDGTVSSDGCDAHGGVSVTLTLSLSRDGAAIPGGMTLPLGCGAFRHDLHPSAGPIHVTAHTMATGNVTVDLTLAAPGSVSHTTMGSRNSPGSNGGG